MESELIPSETLGQHHIISNTSAPIFAVSGCPRFSEIFGPETHFLAGRVASSLPQSFFSTRIPLRVKSDTGTSSIITYSSSKLSRNKAKDLKSLKLSKCQNKWGVLIDKTKGAEKETIKKDYEIKKG